MIANHCAAGLKVCPQAGVDLGSLYGIGNDAKSRENGIDIDAPFHPVRARSSLQPMKQLGDSDSGKFKFFLTGGEPASQVEDSSLVCDEHVSIEDYCHLSSGGRSIFRPSSRS